jgi:FHS family L-fucose permease-like MFS transporter
VVWLPLETVAHPFVASLGDQRTSDQRVNFAQTFNGVGAVLGPLIGGYFIFGVENVPEGESLTSVKVALYSYWYGNSNNRPWHLLLLRCRH